MSYIRIWVHAVWTTKRRERILPKNVRSKLLKHIKENAKEKKICIKEINAEPEHVHALLSLPVDLSISKVIQLLKGESSNWINKNKLTKVHFGWQEEYFAVSVSESQVNKVMNYIRNQEEHHKRKNYLEECDEFMKKYGFDKFSG